MTVMSEVVQTIILLIFIISIITSFMYINKVYHVIQHHKSDYDTYMKNAMPHIRMFKIWNSVFCMIHLACAGVLLTTEGQVCFGWYIYKLPEDQQEYIDLNIYIISRGLYFVCASFFGLGNLIAFIIVGKDAIN